MAHYFVNRYAELTGDSPDDILVNVSSRSLRVNTLKTSIAQLTQRLQERGVRLKRVPFLDAAYTFSSSFSLGSTEEYLLGHYYLQEIASQVPVVKLHAFLTSQDTSLAGLDVLDMCAAPGSKTTQIASYMQNSGRLVALDADMNRCESLANNIERCGVTCAHVYHKDARFVDDLSLQFDVVLLDAPCSGNFCSEKNWFNKRSMTDPKQKRPLQEELLRSGLDVLKPGGLLMYSTCSLEIEENELVLDSVLDDSYEIVQLEHTIGSRAATTFRQYSFREDMKYATRLWPHRDNTQGFFFALIRKVD